MQDVTRDHFYMGSAIRKQRTKICTVPMTSVILASILNRLLVQWGRCCRRFGIPENGHILPYKKRKEFTPLPDKREHVRQCANGGRNTNLV